MNKYLTYLAILPILASCNEENLSVEEPFNAEAVEIKGVEAYIDGNTGTRAAALDAYNYVGRSAFVNQDQMVLTSIKRTTQPIAGFNYSGIVYNQVVETGQTSGGWNRDESKGRTEAKNEAPDRIYWSDAHNGHTYIGYSLPQQPDGKTFDWICKSAYEGAGSDGISVYYGSLGNPFELIDPNNHSNPAFIDYTNEVGDEGIKDDPTKDNSAISKKSGNEKIMRDDLLLTYDTEKVAETGGSVAKLYYHHALAMVRVVVNIQGFSASSTAADSRSVVSGMILKNMLTLYKWRQQSFEAEALDATYDTNNINAIYNNGGDDILVPFDQKKDVHLWIPRPEGTGTGVGKQFTFYGLAVPCSMGVDNASTDEEKANNLHFEFKVKYPNPMRPTEDVSKTYSALMPDHIVFKAGHCTTINISLNHSNEQMTVGAEYMDWQLVETPDEGELKKNLTFLEHSDRNKVTIFGDAKATVDDATWLYVAPEPKKIFDIYGNDGTEANPFKISTAEQLLSFAYEVKGTGRKAVDQVMVFSPTEDYALMHVSEGAPFDFTGYYVKLDADITMQKSLEIMHDANGFYKFGSENAHDYSVNPQGVIWPGIGDEGHTFNGVFNGGYRHINRLYGEPFFNTIGEDGIVDHLFFSDALGITGRGSIAEVNYGVICGAYIEGDVEAINTGTSTGSYCGSIVGENHSMLISCAHIGDIKGTNYEYVGALLGYNDGIVAICYNCGDVSSTVSGDHTFAGIGKYTPRSIAYCSYFNGDLYHGHDYSNLNTLIGHVAYPLTTAMMQSNVFVNKVAPYVDLTKEHEIINDGLPLQDDPFFYHLSLNYGIRRAVAMLKRAINSQEPDTDGTIIVHNVTAGEPNPYEVLRLKKSLVQWLIDHYSKEVSGGELEFSHQFRFIPGTYPKLQ